jgi:hypothetical protein
VPEKHLEDFLVQNWAQTDLGKTFVIFEEDGEKVGQHYKRKVYEVAASVSNPPARRAAGVGRT